MYDFGRVELIGRVVADATLGKTTSGKDVANFRLAWNPSRKADSPTVYVTCRVWGAYALKMQPNLTKGRQIHVDARLARIPTKAKTGTVSRCGADAFLTKASKEVVLKGLAQYKAGKLSLETLMDGIMGQFSTAPTIDVIGIQLLGKRPGEPTAEQAAASAKDAGENVFEGSVSGAVDDEASPF